MYGVSAATPCVDENLQLLLQRVYLTPKVTIIIFELEF